MHFHMPATQAFVTASVTEIAPPNKLVMRTFKDFAGLNVASILMVVSALSLTLPLNLDAQNIRHVSPTGTDTESDCTDSMQPCRTINHALTVSVSGDEIWVVSGVYTPTLADDPSNVTTSEREVTFQLKNGVQLLGGFSGGETSADQRDWIANPTVMSGNIVNPPTDPSDATEDVDFLGDFSFHVVTASGADATAVLDGFTITGGSNNSQGAGILSDGGSPTLRNLIISNNNAGNGVGGGLFLNESTSEITNVSFIQNDAGSGGGAYIKNGNPNLSNVRFAGNFAVNGGAMFIDDSDLSLINAVITGNAANLGGGGLFLTGSSPSLTNVTISGNQALIMGGGGISAIENSNPVLRNVIIWNNLLGFDDTESAIATILNDNSVPDIAFSLIANSGGSAEWDTDFGTDNGFNLDLDPQFVTPVVPGITIEGDVRVASGSVAVNAGDPATEFSGFPSDVNGNPIDLDGNHRFQGTNIDMGAFESAGLSVQLNGQEGFRMLSSPASTTVGDLVAPLWTQGIIGANFEGGSPNVWTWDNTAGGQLTSNWQPLNDLSAIIEPGDGILVYVFEDDVLNEPGSWPKTLSVSGATGELPYSPNINPVEGGLTLIGNPTGSSIVWSEVQRSGIGDVIYVWDPNANAWVTSDGTTGDLDGGVIRPFQSFFVLTTDADANEGAGPSLEIGKTAKPGTFYGKSDQVSGAAAGLNYLRLQLGNEELQSSAWVRFSEEGSRQFGPLDGLKLAPLSGEYVNLATLSSDGKLLDLQHVPMPDDNPVKIDIVTDATASGTYTLTVSDVQVPTEWELKIIDKLTETSYRVDEQMLIEIALDGNSASSQSESDPVSRFKLQVQRLSLTSSEDPDLPESIALLQNYPNPFNPVTRIRFALPFEMQVELDVFDVYGQRVAELTRGRFTSGEHSVSFSGEQLASGVYIVRMVAGGSIQTRKMMLLK